MTIAEQMAIAVLKGNMVEALVLADHLLEEYNNAKGFYLPKLKEIPYNLDNIRVVLFMRSDIEHDQIDFGGTERALRSWLRGGDNPFILVGVERMEIYEIRQPDNQTENQLPTG